ncbi:hypothetical protein ACJX0J_006955 [Zea mays]
MMVGVLLHFFLIVEVTIWRMYTNYSIITHAMSCYNILFFCFLEIMNKCCLFSNNNNVFFHVTIFPPSYYNHYQFSSCGLKITVKLVSKTRIFCDCFLTSLLCLKTTILHLGKHAMHKTCM